MIPAAERALESGSPQPLSDVLCGIVQQQIGERHGYAMRLKEHAGEGVAEARRYVEAMLGLQVWAHGVYRMVLTDPRAHTGAHAHE